MCSCTIKLMTAFDFRVPFTEHRYIKTTGSFTAKQIWLPLSLIFSLYFCSQNLQNSRGQTREFGDGQRDRQKNPSPTASEEDNVILSSIKNRGIQGQKSHLTY